MLKALELVGFKSFADKTRFEFPRGITVVVGPNGSGKSNIVDAIKWVLGEQSVKSLRGKEMADVIFNGSASRKPQNAAECTLTFDNSTKLLAIDTADVQITRRVYRSGEGEYLINKQPCRLRDIRDLFAGTGVATEAYSVIEQGKVDVMLQASPRDRRMIFEEAAGISRFKAKKIEAQRRLERVEQNLLRLKDIVDEVENRLKTVRNQAGKARKYKEYSDRLQSLRTQVGLTDWRKLSRQLAELEAEVTQASDEASAASAEAESLEATTLGLDVKVAECDQAIYATESRAAAIREQIATHESTIEHERRRAKDFEDEIARHCRHLTNMNVRAGDLEQQFREVAAALQSAETQYREGAEKLREDEQALAQITSQLDEIRSASEQRRAAQLEHLRSGAALGRQISSLEAKLATAKSIGERGSAQLIELDALTATLSADVATMNERLSALTAALAQCERDRSNAESQLAERRSAAIKTQQELSQLRERLSGATERAALIEELEKRLEGVTAGVKDLIAKARDAETGPFISIRGLVADLVNVEIETARIIEVALGDAAQYLVISPSSELIQHLQTTNMRFAGRVGFVRHDIVPTPTAADSLDLNGQPGVLGRADRFVETTPEFAPLAKRLLGRTWIVENLARALELHESTGRGVNFVTLAGDLLSMDGTLQMGPRQSATGLISRRSELRALRHQLSEMTAQVKQGEADKQQLEEQILENEQALREIAETHQKRASELNEHRLHSSAAIERLAIAQKQQEQLSAEVLAAEHEFRTASESLTTTQQKAAEHEARARELEASSVEDTARLNSLDTARQQANRETNAARIELARIEQQLADLNAQTQQLDRDQQERGKALSETKAQLAHAMERLQGSEASVLRAEGIVAELYLAKETEARQSITLVEERDAIRVQKFTLVQDSQKARNRMRKLEAKLHVKELAANEVRHERTTLVERLRDDYGIEIATLERETTEEQIHEREAAEAEIADLRSKLNSIGAVNLEALSELEELETRFSSLDSQFQDLTSAKNSLELIIQRINADSRRLFAETLEVVRGHFQQLFRKLFGGGQADIILDEGVDILESGIEIVARPPGKEPRNISLLSGGEKTLTCAALLLAIFRSRPSPFCVLDEVDAALDEANIDRFVSVLKEFLAWTQFIVVTHSKKTMTAASTLYGVTMQESGVSKRVSVRFEDVTDTGEFTSYRDVEEPSDASDETAAA